MKQETGKKKLTFKKTLVANMNNDAASQILGGGGTTFSDTPCLCSNSCGCDGSSSGSIWDMGGCDCPIG